VSRALPEPGQATLHAGPGPRLRCPIAGLHGRHAAGPHRELVPCSQRWQRASIGDRLGSPFRRLIPARVALNTPTRPQRQKRMTFLVAWTGRACQRPTRDPAHPVQASLVPSPRRGGQALPQHVDSDDGPAAAGPPGYRTWGQMAVLEPSARVAPRDTRSEPDRIVGVWHRRGMA
jgi:hypothetical protein